jgi:3-oxoacyl-[acyl-carrier-protein] synthase II
MTKKRVVITGMSVVSCFGNDVAHFYDQLLKGKSGISPITGFPCEDFPTRFAGEIKDFDPGEYLDKKQARRLDKFAAYSMVAGKKALESGQVDSATLEKLNKQRCGVLVSSGMGGMSVFCDGVQTLLEKGNRRVSPFFVPLILTNMGGALIAMDLGFMGPNYSISTACATGNNAIIAAANHIRNGEADLMLCGGAEAPIIPMAVAGFCACKALSQRNEEPTKASRPWDKARDGFVIGEGAGVLLLESLEHALARGAPILAEYLGGGLSCDAHNMTEPRPDGAGVTLCIQNALHDAQVRPEQVNYVNAHGTSTPAGDMAEVKAVKKVLTQPNKVIMNSTKSMIGHSLGAAGGLEAVVTVKAIQTGLIHPTINLDDPEPDLDFIVPTQQVEAPIDVAISNSFGFGGHNATVVFGKYKP